MLTFDPTDALARKRAVTIIGTMGPEALADWIDDLDKLIAAWKQVRADWQTFLEAMQE